VTRVSAELQLQFANQQMTASRKALVVTSARDVLVFSQCTNTNFSRGIRKICV